MKNILSVWCPVTLERWDSLMRLNNILGGNNTFLFPSKHSFQSWMLLPVLIYKMNVMFVLILKELQDYIFKHILLR